MKICMKCGFDRVVKMHHNRPDNVDKADIYWRCLKCKHEEYGRIEKGCVHVEPEFSVIVESEQELELIQVLGVLRRVDSSLAKIPLSELKQVLINEGGYTLGNFNRNELDEAISVLNRHKIRYEVKFQINGSRI